MHYFALLFLFPVGLNQEEVEVSEIFCGKDPICGGDSLLFFCDCWSLHLN